MYNHSRKVEGVSDAVNIVGTGGDGANIVNILTGASILAAVAGAKVANHGICSSSLGCESVDVLEALGVMIDMGPKDKVGSWYSNHVSGETESVDIGGGVGKYLRARNNDTTIAATVAVARNNENVLEFGHSPSAR